MKIGAIIKTNQKGQIVIPKEIRDALSINNNVNLQILLRGQGIYIYPVEHTMPKSTSENLYPQILEKTKGSWNKEDWSMVRKKRRKIELNASEKRKSAW